jgi:hypothetical protein
MVHGVRVAVLLAIIGGSSGCGERRGAVVEAKLAELDARVRALEKDPPPHGGPSPAGTSKPDLERPTTTEAARRTLESLRAEPVSVDFTNADVGMVLQLLLDEASANRVLSPAAAAVHTPITLKLDGSNAYDALQAIVATSALRWRIDESGIVRITTADDLLDR